ncbi:GNAT family N-acetyltransferase [Chitinophaga pendula]|uniref:GNAT family N-acetyltransferase n=1 Tax=Chitinophaga TaxID=79328 RepID=UPI000BAFAECB|nr:MULTISPECIES: GNAT family N-acetyltransferase [Chitinophaga]ASZ11851.1 GNAT family N-acetyltransferase [Chitinophaga sp. MD30]UCJ05124.1 GNAT family N-acetyltransferase [Chitinophaga pendula]
MTIRPITPADDQQVGNIIRTVLAEFGVNRPGTAYYDEQIFTLSAVFDTPGAAYWIATSEDTLVGGAGIFPTAGLPNHYCELVKFYLLPQSRGKGIGRSLLQKAIDTARQMGYTHMYLETLPELTIAIPQYEKAGFKYLDGPLGNSGHYACTVWMLKEL